jgi:four helix bundle protein
MGSDRILSYRDLDVWNVAMDLCVLVYEIADLLPKTEKYELSSQMRRAAVSVPSNVAEGHSFGTAARCVHHLRISLGSVGELDTQFELAVRLEFVTESDLIKARAELARTRQLLHGLLRAKRAQILKAAGKASALLVPPAIGWLLVSLLR